MPRVVVVGGGIAGLSAAYRLIERDPAIEVSLLERGDRVGGAIVTERTNGFVIDRGPESILTEKPAAMRLVERLGLGARIVRTSASRRGAYVVCRGGLERIPDGFSLLAPTDLKAFLRSPILSVPGRLRAIAELALPRGPAVDDESLGSFVTRRFGSELPDRLAQPMVSGIYGANPDTLSLRATMPRFLDAEREHGSVIRALRAKLGAAPSEAAQGARYGLFVNFDDGMQVLPDALRASLGARIELGRGARTIARVGDAFTIECDDGSTERADGVVVALPAHRASPLVAGLDRDLASELDAIDFGSAAIVTLTFLREHVPHPLDAYGYVSPVVERRAVVASTWSSEKWPGRAPASHVLLRFFVGRDGDERVIARADDELVAIARAEAREILGVTATPELVRVDRFVRAMPRYRVGHLARVAGIEAREAAIPRFGLAGASYRGVGIPDSIASGERAADRVLTSLARA